MYNPANNKPELFAQEGRNLHWYRADKPRCIITDSFLSNFTEERVFMGELDTGLTRIGGTMEYYSTFDEAKQALIDSCNRDIEFAHSTIQDRKNKLEKLKSLTLT